MSKQTLRDLVAHEQVFAPCVYDCLTAKAAELNGYKALMLSGGAVTYSMNGQPDMAMLTIDELVWAVERITTACPLPLAVDADDGYAESPVVVYRNVKRLVKAGAMALTIDDTTGIRGFERMVAHEAQNTGKPFVHRVISRKHWLAKIKAAVAACEASDCMVIARTECVNQHGFDEAIERCVRARELGAQMTTICGGMNTLEQGKQVAQYDTGWKMWPDVISANGKPNVTLEEIKPLGFNLVTMHVYEKAAMCGMMIYGKAFIKDRNFSYVRETDIGGQAMAEAGNVLQMNRGEWIQMERRAAKRL